MLTCSSTPVGTGAIVVVEDVWGEAFEQLARDWPVLRCPEAWSDEDLLRELARGAKALVVRNRTVVGRDLLQGAPNLQVVARAGVGLDNVDIEAADDMGVVVLAAPGANAPSVAEMAVGLAISLARDIVGHDRRVRAGRWERRAGVELAGRCWGVVGLGATGRATAHLARGLGMKTLGFDPYLAATTPLDCLDARAWGLDELLATSDVVSLHVPLYSQTQRMADQAFFSKMKLGAYLVNVARGGLVDEEALLDALESGHLAGAGLDVRDKEPPVLGVLEQNPSVVLTPHVAGLTVEAQRRVAEALVADLKAVLGGAAASNAVGRWSKATRRTPDP